MPHATMKLHGGVEQNETPVLNEAGISSCNLVRFVPDTKGGSLIQKLGGWSKYYSSQMVAIVRSLWAWEDTNANKWLAAGTQSRTSGAQTGQAQLAIMNGVLGSNGITTATTLADITPRLASDDVAVSFSTTSGSPTVTIVDTTTTGITSYDSVYISTQVSVGGLVLYGLYPVISNAGSTSYTIQATDVLGNLLAASSTVTNGGAVASFATTSGSAAISVTLNNHGYSLGSTFPILVSTTVGGVTLLGNYTVQSITSADIFVINGPQSATSTTTASINSGNVRFVYNIGYGPQIASTGYGIGGYGIGGYGTGSPVVATTGTPIGATGWSFDNWGQILLASSNGTVSDGINFTGIYQWDPTANSPVATVIPQAPPVNDGFFVAMPQRQIVAWGSTFTGVQDPLLIRWCDINNFNSWIGTVTNQAGSYRIPKGSMIVGCIQGPQQALVWTDLALWSMQYINQPYVYSFNELATGCGLKARRAATSMNGVVYWMGQSQFFSLSANGVTPLICPIWDVVFQDLDQTNLDKIRVAANSRFGEVSWFYPVYGGGGEVTNYIKYNVILDKWDYGVLGRTAWINESVLGPPIGADPNSLYIYQHETSQDADGQALQASFTSGYFSLSEADVKTFIDEVWPDMKWGYFGGNQNATVQLTFYVNDFPGQTPTAYGPFTLTEQTTFVSPRIRGRLVQIQISSNDIGSWWRIGGMRYRYQPDGRY
jgi:hypothetical protein